jgi:hypothetical protein
MHGEQNIKSCHVVNVRNYWVVMQITAQLWYQNADCIHSNGSVYTVSLATHNIIYNSTLLLLVLFLKVNSLFGIATRYGLDGPGIESR